MKVRLLLGLQLLLLGALGVGGVNIAPLRKRVALGVLRKLVDLEKVDARARARLCRRSPGGSVPDSPRLMAGGRLALGRHRWHARHSCEDSRHQRHELN